MQPPPDAADTPAAILASGQPALALQARLEALDAADDLAGQVRLFEALVWRIDIREYWVWFRMGGVYGALGRADAAFFCAQRAAAIHPDWPATETPYGVLYRHFRAAGDEAAAVAVLERQRRLLPDKLLAPAEETAPLLRAHGIDPAASAPDDAVFARVAAVIRAEFHQPDLAISPHTTADDVPGWDSLAHARVLLALERAFGIRFAAGEALAAEDVGALAAVVARKVPVRRKLIVYGNCQAGALALVLRHTPAVTARYDIAMHDLWATGETLARNLRDFDSADILLRQDVTNWRTHPLCHALPGGLRTLVFPFCYVGALWPFDSMVRGADEKMLQAKQAIEAAGREFPFGFQDGLLARLRDEVPEAEERLRRYRTLDVPGVPDLVRYAEMEEARLLADDARLGSTIGAYIATHYRHERLFHAIAHPTSALIQRLATELLARLGIDAGTEGVGSYDDYMGHYQVPLHPAVIDALGITWADAQTRYNFHRREALTFDDYFRRYIAVPV